MAPPRDTSRNAFAAQIERLMNAGPAGRLAMAADMSDAVRELAAAGVRRRDLQDDRVRIDEASTERPRKRTKPRSHTTSK